MQLINAPAKLVLPFANAGAKNTIPTASQVGIVAGAASLTDGFPPLTRTPLAAGGVPPSGLDMNGILYELSAVIRWANAGGGYPYDSTFANDTNVGGYPKGARVMRSDGLGYWFNTADNNVTDPEGAGAVAAGWVPDFTTGAAAVTMTSANVTLTAAQYGKPIIVITGLLTANLNLIFPSIAGEWTVINNTTGAYSITCKTAAGTGVAVTQSAATIVYGDATNIGGFAYLTQASADLRYAALAGLATQEFSVLTAPQFNSSALGASTAFVQRALGNKSEFQLITATATLTAADVGKALLAQGPAMNVTLPQLSAIPNGAAIELNSQSANSVTVLAQGPDVISINNANGSATSMTVGDGETLLFVKVSSAKWMVLGGAASLKYAAGFKALLADAGYQKLPSGRIEQHGTFTANVTPGAAVAVTFPIPFPTACRNITITPINASATTSSAWFDTPGPAGFNGRCNVASLVCHYSAIGD